MYGSNPYTRVFTKILFFIERNILLLDELTYQEKIAFKLIRKRKDGSYGPLFINKKQKLEIGIWYESEDHPTKGYAHRPGWHSLSTKIAPHLTEKNRVWCKVSIREYKEFTRPENQGGLWFLSTYMKILEIFD